MSSRTASLFSEGRPAGVGPGAGSIPARSTTPIEAVARAIEQAEATAAPLADLPFSLTPETAKAAGKQEDLF